MKSAIHLGIFSMTLTLALVADYAAPQTSVSATSEDTEGSNAGKSKTTTAVMELAQLTFDRARKVKYIHLKEPADRQVVEENGEEVACTDCSGFVSFLLHRVSPRHYKVIRQMQPERPYPQAKSFARFFCDLKRDLNQNGSAAEGWQSIKDCRNLKEGDFIAWEKERPQGSTGKSNSGHVAIVLTPPAAPQEMVVNGKSLKFISIDVLDSSSVYHFPPEQLPPHSGQNERNGLGKGHVRLILNRQGQAVGYWEGTYKGETKEQITGPSYSGTIGFARLVDF